MIFKYIMKSLKNIMGLEINSSGLLKSFLTSSHRFSERMNDACKQQQQ